MRELTPKQKAAVRQMSKAFGISASDIVRAIDQYQEQEYYLKQEEKRLGII